MQIKVLGVSGSPSKGGNVETFLGGMLNSIFSEPGIITDKVFLAEHRIEDCRHCNYCIRK